MAQQDGAEYEIRVLQESDLYIESGFYATLENLRKEERIDIENMRRQFRRRQQSGVVTYVVVLGGQIVATTSVVFEDKFIHNGGRIAHVEDVATRKGYEGRGYAKALLQQATTLARQEGCYKVILDCSFDNVLFYVKQGMRPVEICMRVDL